jgi:hypothetical protein
MFWKKNTTFAKMSGVFFTGCSGVAFLYCKGTYEILKILFEK